jgi:hypothetical protein
MLSACTSFHGLLASEEEANPSPEELAAVPQAAPRPKAGSDEWCQRVAAGDRLQAQQTGFDAATLDRMTALSYQQCMALGTLK